MNNPTPLLDAARGACIALPQHHHGEKHRQPNQHCTAPHEPLTYRPTLEERSFLRSLRATNHRKGKGTYKLEPYGAGCMLIDGPSQEDVDATQQGLNKSISTLQNGNWHMVILDEITIALHLGLITKNDMGKPLNARPPHVELFITGRYASEWLINRCDLVTEMKEIKHYYTHGVKAREGIER